MRSTSALLAGLLALSPLLATQAAAQSSPSAAPAATANWPTRALKVIVPFPPGGFVDVAARLVGQKLSEALSQPVVIENRAGASGTLGVDIAIKSPPDGYTVLIASGDFITVPSLMPATTYDPYADLIPVTRIATTPLILLTHPKSGLNSVKEAIEKAKAAPGAVTFGSPGHGTINQIAAEWLALEADVKLLHVPYRGGAAMANGIAAGDIALGVTAPGSVQGLIDGGKLKVLALMSRERPAFLPAAWPTMADTPYQVDASLTVGVYLPRGTPAAIVSRLDAEMQTILKDETIRKRFAELGMDVQPVSQGALATLIRSEAARFKTVIDRTGITANAN